MRNSFTFSLLFLFQIPAERGMSIFSLCFFLFSSQFYNNSDSLKLLVLYHGCSGSNTLIKTCEGKTVQDEERSEILRTHKYN